MPSAVLQTASAHDISDQPAGSQFINANCTVGSFLIGVFRVTNQNKAAMGAVTFTDDVNGVWTNLLSFDDSQGGSYYVAYFQNNASAAHPTVSITWANNPVVATPRWHWVALEYPTTVVSGVVDQSNSNTNGTPTTTPAAASITTTNSADRILTFYGPDNEAVTDFNTAGSAPASGWQQSGTVVGTDAVTVYDVDVAATGTYHETFTLAGADSFSTITVGMKTTADGGTLSITANQTIPIFTQNVLLDDPNNAYLSANQTIPTFTQVANIITPFGSLIGTLVGGAGSITNPTDATGSVPVKVGDLIVAVIGQQTALTATAVTDNLGNTYTAQNAGTDPGNVTGRMFYSRVTVAGTLTAVHFAATASANDVSVSVAVLGGPFVVSPIDANPSNGTTDMTTPYLCPATGTLSQADEAVVCWFAKAANASWTATAPNLKAVQQNQSANVVSGIGYQTVAVTTTVSPEWTGTAATVEVLGTASFKKDTIPAPLSFTGNQTIPAFTQTFNGTVIDKIATTSAVDVFTQTANVGAVDTLTAAETIPAFTQTFTALAVSGGQATFVQMDSAHDVTVSPFPISFTQAAAHAGSVLVLAIKCNQDLASLGTVTVTDPDNGSWTVLTGIEDPDGHALYVAYKENVAATFTQASIAWTGGGAKSISAGLLEYSTTLTSSVVDFSNSKTFTTTATPDTPTATTTNAIDTLVAILETSTAARTVSDVNGAGSVPSSGWTLRGTVNGTNLILADAGVSATGTSYKDFVTLSGTDTGASFILALKTPVASGSITANQTIPAFTQAVSVGVLDKVTAAQSIPDFTQAANDNVLVKLTAAQTIPVFTQFASIGTPARNITVAETIPAFTQTANLTALPTLLITAAQTIPAFTQTFTGLGPDGQLIPDFTQSCVVKVRVKLTMAHTVAAFTQTFNSELGALPIPGLSANQTIPAFTQTTSLGVIDNITAPQTIPPFTQLFVIGSLPVNLSANQAIPVFTQTANTKVASMLTETHEIDVFPQSATMKGVVKITAAQQIPVFRQHANIGPFPTTNGNDSGYLQLRIGIPLAA